MLVTCPECSKGISSKAESCPHCGYPISHHYKAPAPSRPHAPPVQTIVNVKRGGMGCLGCLFWIVVIFVVLPAVLWTMKVKWVVDTINHAIDGVK
jgi:uncharacterized OB-fold protein